VAVRFERSHNTDRALAAAVRPSLRGILHRAAAILAVPAAIGLVLAAPPGPARVAAGLFGACIAAMFAISATVHYRVWAPHTTEVLFRLDHTGIYLAIAGTATPVGVLALDGWHQTALVGGVWAVALVGIVLEWLPFPTPRGVAHGLFLVLGWATVPFLPAVVRNAGWGAASLLLAGGLVYTVGATIVAVQRPDPVPHVFGYHEVWHLLVIVAVGLHYTMVGATLLPVATGAG
jgi:hemolysin III